LRDRYHGANRRIMRRQQSRRGLGDTDGLAFVSHAGAVFLGTASVGHRNLNSQQGIPSPINESYLLNSAIFARPLGFGGKREAWSNIAEMLT
jgi:hypothetical protein